MDSARTRNHPPSYIRMLEGTIRNMTAEQQKREAEIEQLRGSKVQSVQNTTNATNTTASSSPNPSAVGQSVTFTSTTTSSGGVPVGTVTFTEGATVWASNVTVDGAGHASFSTTSLAVGSHTITATFTGATGWGNSSGNAAPQVVNGAAATTTALSSSSNPSVFSQPVTLTATVTATPPGTGTPTGTVTFKNGTS